MSLWSHLRWLTPLPLLLAAGSMMLGAVPGHAGKPAKGIAAQLKPVCPHETAAAEPFRFSVDGEALVGGTSRDDVQACVDKALQQADIQVRYDGLDHEPRLNVVAGPDAALVGGRVVFATHTNYALQLVHGEIRLFEAGVTTTQKPTAVIQLRDGAAVWTVPPDLAGDVTYVLRVYDQAGRFDETSPKILDIAKVKGGKLDRAELASVYNGNALSVRNVPVSGGAVLVAGRGIPAGQTVTVMGARVPVDPKGDFAVRQILPAGTHSVDVVIADDKGIVSAFSRSATIPTYDFFYVALADILVGKGSASGPIDLLRPATADEYKNEIQVNGRVAFYLKGKVAGDTLLTAAADTRDQPIRHIFSNFDSKDPRYLLRNLDPTKYYPVYGDDSTLHDDAPTRGKFYVRVERGDSSIVWGNFKTTVTGTEYVRYERGLYGIRAQTKTADSTRWGERRGQLEGFAAEPGTLGARDVFRGTGGSLYYLQRQNISEGSERVTIEERDRATGLVTKTRQLIATQDYDINYLQGRVLLKTPLASTGNSDFVVQSGALSGTELHLVVNYEYAPGLSASRDRVVGLRGSYWLDDHVQLGMTGYDQDTPGQAVRIGGMDITLRTTPSSYVKIEGARSHGPGSGEAVSADGGYSFSTRQSNGQVAWARRIEGAADLSEFLPGVEGRVAAFWKDKERDYSAPGELAIARAAREAGLVGSVKLDEHWSAKSKADMKRDEFRHYMAAEQNATYTFNDYWKATIGARLDDNQVSTSSASSVLNQQGRRADVAAKIVYDFTTGLDALHPRTGDGRADRRSRCRQSDRLRRHRAPR